MSCGAPHALSASQRAAFDARWRDALAEGEKWAMSASGDESSGGGGAGGGAAGKPAAAGASTEVAARAVLSAAERVLKQSAGKLCESHATRHAAAKLKVYALSALSAAGGGAAGEMVAALEEVVRGMEAHLPSAHPNLAFFRRRLAEALVQQAEGEPAGSALRARARGEAARAADALAIAYGAEHPTVKRWRAGYSTGYRVVR